MTGELQNLRTRGKEDIVHGQRILVENNSQVENGKVIKNGRFGPKNGDEGGHGAKHEEFLRRIVLMMREIPEYAEFKSW
ncbi:10650_t:CDS:2 [Ambispora gerdemannii]|uniref:10650_t:CDS:1 n=1 Tax=Ambispora gerdemannii TaxID=144530 RepID=A0A9N9CCP2_9GLOM|nr:10650_t:CDS:2 [Ambispora gerdemannii]